MKHTARSLTAALLCLCICMRLAGPAFAANSNGITFTANLSKNTFTVSQNPQTVTMDIVASAPVTVDGIGGTITMDDPLELTSISSGEAGITFEASRMDLSNGRFGWSSPDAENVENVSTLVRATFTIPANTPAGTYTVGVTGLELTEDYGDVWESGATVTASFTIAEPVVAEGYTVALSTLTPNPTHEGTFDVTVGITHSEAAETHFAAGQFHITYDNQALTLTGITASQPDSNLYTNTVVDGNTTTLKIADFGPDKMLGSGVYTLHFTAANPGVTTLTLSNAGFTTKDNATTKDLEAATCAEALSVNVLKKTFTVTLPEYGFVSDSDIVTDGESFTFRISDPYYDYGTVYVAMNGGEPVALEPNSDGTYTIPAVTGNVVITTEKQVARSYGVTFVGEYESGENTATYMTDYQFTLKPDKAADATQGYSYCLKSITIGGVEYKNYTVEDLTYTIPGKDIKGDILVTIEKTEYDPAYVAVSYTGHPGSVQNQVATTPYGEDYILTLVKISGYDYTVTATMGGEEVDVLDNGNSTYTIQKVTGDLVIHIGRTVNTSGVEVTHYLTLNGSNMYLILKDPADSNLDENYIPTYDGQPMYWSDRYSAYCYLIIASESVSLEDVKAKIELAELSDTVVKTIVPYNMDVNMTGKVDAADAQLVYNLYSNPNVTAFTDQLSMLKFLAADLVGEDKVVNTNDAVAIIHYILDIQTAQ